MASKLHVVTNGKEAVNSAHTHPTLDECIRRLNIDTHQPLTWPFMPGDATTGAESELQVAVRGAAEDVDLPLRIRQSNYFSNVIRRASAGDSPQRIIRQLERYLEGSPDNIWENSWVRFPTRVLSRFTNDLLTLDLKEDKSAPDGPFRSDVDEFFLQHKSVPCLRVPISYLLKLALSNAVTAHATPELVEKKGKQLLNHFLSDNTSPESFSFHIVSLRHKNKMGAALASEVARRHLLTHVLVQYANVSFELKDNGQEAMVFSSPSPPIRQRFLNNAISDSFYRELFMSPCLSGWDQGEKKHAYMKVCHKTLSLSQLNTVAKLKEAGIIVNNLVVLPSTSSTCLANNGIHISLGSRKLTALRNNPDAGFEASHEKYLADLVIKIVEHFLPLFAGRYSAAPHRFGFSDFHPERALGFLPHELDYTHLRMLWRRWKRKARIRAMGKCFTPFGPEWLDELWGRVFSLKGDFLIDVRLIDYLVAVLSTENSPSLNGVLNNDIQLKNDLHSLGVFDRRMSLYQLYKMRSFDQIGFSGFEGRFYSLFPSFQHDLAGAVDMQLLVTALAYKYVIQGICTHEHIPDTPFIESERRQIFFATVIGLPTFYIREDAGNLFLQRILKLTRRSRKSRRYPGYLRVYLSEYQEALLKTINQDAADLIGIMGFRPRMDDLERRIREPESAAAWSKISRGILGPSRKAKPMQVRSQTYNEMAELYYREALNQDHLAEGLSLLRQDLLRIEADPDADIGIQQTLQAIIGPLSTAQFLDVIEPRFMTSEVDADEWVKLIHLILLAEHVDALANDQENDQSSDQTPQPLFQAAFTHEDQVHQQ